MPGVFVVARQFAQKLHFLLRQGLATLMRIHGVDIGDIELTLSRAKIDGVTADNADSVGRLDHRGLVAGARSGLGIAEKFNKKGLTFQQRDPCSESGQGKCVSAQTASKVDDTKIAPAGHADCACKQLLFASCDASEHLASQPVGGDRLPVGAVIGSQTKRACYRIPL